MDKRFKMTYLLDIYGGLLTAKQQTVLSMHYNDDMSLTEIAASENVSRQAAFELVKRAEKQLCDYDGKLGLFERYLRNCECLNELAEFVRCGENNEAAAAIERLREGL